MTETVGAHTWRRDVVTVDGPDAEAFLQGQLSQDLSRMGVATSVWSLLLEPQGKLVSWIRVTKTAADRFLLDVDADAGATTLARLQRFLIRTKAEMTLETRAAVAVRGPAERSELPDGVLRLPVVGPGVDGYDLLAVGVDGLDAPSGAAPMSEAQFRAHQVEHGIPTSGRELTGDTIPAEVGQWLVDASVSFSKGCFTGQELVARIDSRGGNVPRHLRVLVVDDPVEEGQEVTATADEDRPVGVVTTTAISERFGNIALAFCHRRVGVGDEVRVDGTTGIVHDPPLR